MTREKAIDIIKCLAWHTRPNEEDIEQAIKALEQEPTIKNDCNTCTHSNEADGSNCYECVKDMCNNYEPTTKNDLGVDCVSREQAKIAIRDKFKDLPLRVEINTILNELPSVTPQPCEDAISRKAVLNQIFYSTDNNGDVALGSALRERIAELPSVAPQEPILEKINKMKSEIADSLEFWDYSPNNNPLARDILETLTNFWGDIREVE